MDLSLKEKKLKIHSNLLHLGPTHGKFVVCNVFAMLKEEYFRFGAPLDYNDPGKCTHVNCIFSSYIDSKGTMFIIMHTLNS